MSLPSRVVVRVERLIQSAANLHPMIWQSPSTDVLRNARFYFCSYAQPRVVTMSKRPCTKKPPAETAGGLDALLLKTYFLTILWMLISPAAPVTLTW
jgi:hypothetical protein